MLGPAVAVPKCLRALSLGGAPSPPSPGNGTATPSGARSGSFPRALLFWGRALVQLHGVRSRSSCVAGAHGLTVPACSLLQRPQLSLIKSYCCCSVGDVTGTHAPSCRPWRGVSFWVSGWCRPFATPGRQPLVAAAVTRTRLVT